MRCLTPLAGSLFIFFLTVSMLLKLRHCRSDDVDEVAEQSAPRQLDDHCYHDLVLVLRRNVPVADCDNGRHGPVQGVDVLGSPAGVLNTDVLQPGVLWDELGGEEEEECLSVWDLYVDVAEDEKQQHRVGQSDVPFK